MLSGDLSALYIRYCRCGIKIFTTCTLRNFFESPSRTLSHWAFFPFPVWVAWYLTHRESLSWTLVYLDGIFLLEKIWRFLKIPSLGKEFLLQQHDHGFALPIQWFFIESVWSWSNTTGFCNLCSQTHKNCHAVTMIIESCFIIEDHLMSCIFESYITKNAPL